MIASFIQYFHGLVDDDSIVRDSRPLSSVVAKEFVTICNCGRRGPIVDDVKTRAWSTRAANGNAGFEVLRTMWTIKFKGKVFCL